MREIKFRAWDGVHMYVSDDDIHELGKFFNAHWPGRQMMVTPTLMQYTGLKDKNGKEIYEGDIIKIMSRGLLFTCIVHWPYDLEPIDEFGKMYDHMLYSPIWDESEVIGNIYENAEILKEPEPK